MKRIDGLSLSRNIAVPGPTVLCPRCACGGYVFAVNEVRRSERFSDRRVSVMALVCEVAIWCASEEWIVRRAAREASSRLFLAQRRGALSVPTLRLWRQPAHACGVVRKIACDVSA
jgi:hypothetical protein